MSVHARPAAFDGVDGFSYSVDILTDQTGDASAPWGAYLFFVKWGRGEPQVTGHVETPFLAVGRHESLVRQQVGAMPLASVKTLWRVPKFLLDPLGPLSIRPAHLPRLVPWLARFLWASRPAAVISHSPAV